jgi:hypothetical protein
MLRHLQALIRSKVDYKQRRLLHHSVTDPTFNIGVLLATGTFLTSRFESLYVESAEPPLSCGANSSIFRIRQRWQLDKTIHLSLSSFIWSTSTVTNSTLQHLKMCVHFQALLQRLHVRLPHISPVILSPFPPWHVWPACLLLLVRHVRDEASVLTYHLSSCRAQNRLSGLHDGLQRCAVCLVVLSSIKHRCSPVIFTFAVAPRYFCFSVDNIGSVASSAETVDVSCRVPTATHPTTWSLWWLCITLQTSARQRCLLCLAGYLAAQACRQGRRKRSCYGESLVWNSDVTTSSWYWNSTHVFSGML